jgi:CAI-1 autoinducer synthase
MSFEVTANPLELLRCREDGLVLERMGRLWSGDHLLRGKQPQPNDVMLLSNDYLSILGERSLREAQARALVTGGSELLMSSIFTHGDGNPMQCLETAFAAYMESEDSIVCQSGWAANIGLIQSIAEPSVPIYIDLIAHASLWEGARSAGTKAIPFRHNDASHAERQIRKSGPGIIVVDTVYSTNGSLCPLRDFVDVAEKTGCIIVADESHSLGTHGPKGAGITVALGLSKRVHFRTASLAKAFAGRAGLITCSTRFKEYFRLESRPSIFSSALLEHEYVWFNQALHLIANADDRRERLHAMSKRLRIALSEEGFDLSAGSEQIIALPSGSEPETMKLRDALQERGVFGAVFCAPATPKNHCVIRLSVNSGLSDDQIDRTVEGCIEARMALNIPQ